MLNLRQELYDHIKGAPVYLITLTGEDISVTVTNLGCTVTSVCIPDREGVQKNVVAGFEEPGQYNHNDNYLGCVVGRYVNRIGHGRFVLDGQTVQLTLNDGVNHLHGGFGGFHKQVWTVTDLVRTDREVGVVFEYISMDGEEGYPGTLKVRLTYLLGEDRTLRMHYEAVTDKKTPVNLSNHSYFNLTGFTQPTIHDHVLRVYAEGYTEKNGFNLPTGLVKSVSGTPLDFTSPRRIGDAIERLSEDRGLDHNFVLDGRSPAGGAAATGGDGQSSARALPGKLVPAAELSDPVSGRLVRVYTNQPGLQVYTANWWSPATPPGYPQHGAVALETQAFPDGPNRPEFPDTILVPGDTYQSTTIFAFGVL